MASVTGSAAAATKLRAARQSTTPAIAFAKTADAGEQSYLLLHLVRVLALYLYVYLSQNPVLADELLLLSRGAESTSKLELELHALLLACVEAEVASNQFDGLVQEKSAFLAIKKLFRLEKAEAATQCRTLVALLSTYLSLMTAPIVTCAPFSMLTSTLEYLAKGNKKKDVSLSLLYPIVNAIDSLSIEQRECLDALTRVWKWVATRDPSDALLAKLASHHHAAIIQVDAAEPAKQEPSDATDLGACFVTTLLQYSDHIFRHDPEVQAEDLHLHTSLESDTEEDESAEDTSEPEQLSSSSSKTLATTPTLPLLIAAEVEVAVPVVASGKSSPSAKSLSKSMRRRKKKADDKLASKKEAKTKKEEALAVEDATENQPNPAEDESLATAVCVGIAAAAGTIAAALCVIFT